jgi:hypothetical protein
VASICGKQPPKPARERNAMALVVTNCPACSKPTRVPDNRGRIRVTCPTCAYSWSFPIALEHASVTMRCSANGQSFQVNFTRANPDVCYTISNITLAASDFTIVRLGRVGAAPQKPAQHMISYDHLDFLGFYCPSCASAGTDRGSKPWAFVKCGACQQLVCSASVQSMGGHAHRRYRFRCVCGREDTMNGGLTDVITEISGTTRRESTDDASRLRLASKRKALLAALPRSLR